MHRAYLFDIDGTLLKLKNRANRIIIQDILNHFNRNHQAVETMDFAGKTDRDIFSSLLEMPSEELFEEVKQHYLYTLEQKIGPEDLLIFEGVHRTMAYLKNKNAHLGILTGNFEQAAKIKLTLGGLDGMFEFGAFGDHAADRNDLPPVAHDALHRYSGKSFDPSDLVIIGDTPRDILCAQSFGCIAVALTTGSFDRTELQQYSPHVVLDSLTEFPFWDHSFRNRVNGN